MQANIVTLPGDYIGPEIIAQAVKEYPHGVMDERASYGRRQVWPYVQL